MRKPITEKKNCTENKNNVKCILKSNFRINKMPAGTGRFTHLHSYFECQVQ